MREILKIFHKNQIRPFLKSELWRQIVLYQWRHIRSNFIPTRIKQKMGNKYKSLTFATVVFVKRTKHKIL